MRDYLDSVISADQNFDDMAIAANSTEQLNSNLRAVFKCIQIAGLNFSLQIFTSERKRLFCLDEILQQTE